MSILIQQARLSWVPLGASRRFSQDGDERRGRRRKDSVRSMPMVRVCGEVSSGRVSGIVVSKDESAHGGGVVVRVLEPYDDRSKLQKFFGVNARSVRKCDRASYDGGERWAVFVSKGVGDDVRGVEDLPANLRDVFGYGHTSSCSRWWSVSWSTRRSSSSPSRSRRSASLSSVRRTASAST